VRRGPASNNVSKSGRISILGNHNRAMTFEDHNTEDLVCVVVRSTVHVLVTALQLLVITIYKCSINPITNQKPMSSH
jgi:hypothetical protein